MVEVKSPKKVTLETDIIPEWDLSDLYQSPQDPKIDQDIANAADVAQEIKDKFEGKVSEMSPEGFLEAFDLQNKIAQHSYRLGCYVQMLLSIDPKDSDALKLQSKIQTEFGQISLKYSFLDQDLAQLDDAKLTALETGHPDMEIYSEVFTGLRQYRDQMLDPKIEDFLIEQSSSSGGRTVQLYNMLMSKVRMTVEGKEYSLASISELLSDNDPEMREKAYQARSKALEERQDEVAYLYNTIIKERAFMNKKRGFTRPISAQNQANSIEDPIIDQMVEVANDAVPRLNDRYNKLYAKWLGQTEMTVAESLGPNPSVKEPDYIPWQDAVTLVKEAYREFDPEIADMVDQFFDNDWVHARSMDGKESGAYCMPVSTDHHPYILMNYQGKPEDVTTLAHEIGHGVHMMLSNRNPQVVSNAPLTFAEVASVFGEMITFNKLLETQSDLKVQRAMIAGKVEDMLGTYGRQICFHNFETRAHDEVISEGEVSAERLAEIWMEERQKFDGNVIKYTDAEKPGWTRISHFFHVPFYVNSYAFADTTVNVLNGKYEQAKKAGTEADFITKYKELLASGGTKHHKELLKPFGVKAESKSYMQHEIKIISSMLDKLEDLDQQIDLQEKLTNNMDNKPNDGRKLNKRSALRRRRTLNKRLG